MTNYLKKTVLSGLMALLLAAGGTAVADPVQAVFGLDVDNSAAFMGAMDTLFESDDMADHKVSVWAAMFNGSSPTSHVVVAEYDSYAEYESLTKRRLASSDWLRFVNTVDGNSDGTSSALHIQRIVEGSGWRNHEVAAVFIMTVRDPAAYAAAFTEMIGELDNPGSVRLMQIRAGGMGATHIAIITGNGVAAVNEYLDDLETSDAFARFLGKVSSIRTVNTVSMFRRMRSYGD